MRRFPYHPALRLAALAALIVAATPALAAGPPRGDEVVIVEPEELRWTDAASVGPGVKMAVIEGDTKRPEPFTFRLKLPPGARVDVHTHPVAERVTVISGIFHLGIGDKFDRSKAKPLKAGSVAIMQPGVKMFAYTDEETIIQLNGTGPWGISYLEKK
jgi:hypothetical protein